MSAINTASYKIQIPKEMFNPAEFMHVQDSLTIGSIKSGPDTYAFHDPVIFDITITNTGGALLVQGQAQACAYTQCARCLDEAKIDLFGEVEGYVLIDPQSGELDDVEGDEIEVMSEDKTIDIANMITSALILDLPQIPLCDDDCKGICPKCGCNLNTQSCDCKNDDDNDIDKDNPFAVLKNLKLD